jgi:hypothetical protein
LSLPLGIRIAYVAAGQGPPLLRLNNWFTHLEIDRESPVAHLPPRAGVKSTAIWGTRARPDELFGDDGEVRAEPRMFVFRYRSAQHWLEVFRTYYGPMVKAFGALDAGKQEALAADMIALAGRFNHAKDGSGQRVP